MERVQITGQAGDGQYYDNKGRLLYAMGDINITPGMWVWTNGKTIYGHQTAGEQPVIVSTKSVLPYVNSANQIFEITPDGHCAPFVNFRTSNVYAYVGNRKHAYIGIWNWNNEWSVLDWYNVLSGEKIGAFAAGDACIDEKTGDLLTVTVGACTREKSPKIDTYMKLRLGPGFINEDGTINTSITRQTTIDEKSKVKADAVNNSTVKNIIIRRNGKIINQYAPPSIGSAIDKVQKEANRINAANAGAPDTYGGKRPKPDSDRLYAVANIVAIRLCSDTTFTLLTNVYANVQTFPTIRTVGVNGVVYWPILPSGWVDYDTAVSLGAIIPDRWLKGYSDMAGYDARKILLYDMDYGPDKLYTNGTFNDWVSVNIYYNELFLQTFTEVNSMGDNLQISYSDFGIIDGPVYRGYDYNDKSEVMFDGYDLKLINKFAFANDFYLRDIGPGYVFNKVDGEAVAALTAKYPNIVRVFLNAFFYLAMSNTEHDTIAPVYAKETPKSYFRYKFDPHASVQTISEHHKNGTQRIKLTDKLYIDASFSQDGTFPSNLDNITIYTEEGRKLLTLHQSDCGMFANPDGILGIRAVNIKNERVVLTYTHGTNYAPIALYDNSLAQIDWQHGTFTLVPFYDRDLLKRKLKAIADKIQNDV